MKNVKNLIRYMAVLLLVFLGSLTSYGKLVKGTVFDETGSP